MMEEPLLAALRHVRNDLSHICSDIDSIEEHVRTSDRIVCPYVSDLDGHVDELGRHLGEIATHFAFVGAQTSQ